MRSLIALLSIALLLASIPGIAQECTPTTSETWADTGPASEATGQPRHYVDADNCSWWCIMGFIFWVYEESNGIPGLQRGDEVVDDTCGGKIRPDTIVY